MEKRVIVIAGPTCSGKSFLAFELAKLLGSEILSADSRQFYRQLNIGTAKPTPAMMNTIPHHFINSLDIAESYNASDFEKESLKIIDTLCAQNIIPIVAGGSGLYLRAITNGVFNVPSEPALRAELMRDLERDGKEAMYERLKEKDPASARTMLPQNWKRVIRALEVFQLTGTSILGLQNERVTRKGYSFLQICIEWPRALLYERIDDRVDAMMKEGLFREVSLLHELGYSPLMNALNTVGYKELFGVIEKRYCVEEAIRLIKRNTRHYAKRQLTWFRHVSGMHALPLRREQELVDLAVRLRDLIFSVNDFHFLAGMTAKE